MNTYGAPLIAFLCDCPVTAMATLHVDAERPSSGRRKRKRVVPREGEEDKDEVVAKEFPDQAELAPKKVKKWKNKQRVLVFCARGITYRTRHLMNDLRTLMPHSRADTKLDRKDKLPIINEVCEMKNCTKCIFLEMRKKKDAYMWVSNVPSGPSVKFLVENVHTMDELRLTGNCLLGSRPLLSFDPGFSGTPYLEVIQELFTQVFSTPFYHPKTKPFIDHIFHFGLMDGRIWFRNFQIMDEGESLTEIGPRFVLNMIKVFEGSFGGPTLYENPRYITPNAHRRMMKLEASYKYKNKIDARKVREERTATNNRDLPQDPLDDIFDE